MLKASSQQITRLLVDWSSGNEAALESLMPLVYDELRQMARRYMRRQDSGHTFQTTDLIHEAYLKLDGNEQNWENRAHFYGVAAQAMRHILVDYARRKNRDKRGGAERKITFEENAFISAGPSDEIVALDDALIELARLDDRKARVVVLKFFGGLTVEEIARVLKISPVTVKRDWRFSRNWLLRELSKTSPSRGV